MGEIQRPGALYQQVAAEIRNAITAGEFPPGAPLPSETQLIARYGVSRPTVRNAIAALRSEGLIEVIHGKGSFVRALPAPVNTIDRGVTSKGRTFSMLGDQVWLPVEEPAVHRTTTSATTGPQLGLKDGEAAFGCDWLLADPTTGTRLMHRVIIPFATAEDTGLGEAPDSPPTELYTTLAKAGHKLSWSETVGARIPTPEERTTLQLPDATAVLHATRITHGNDDRPLLLEELRISADRAQLTYRITPDKITPARRSRA
ncbi:GntR family transcriptional regulator [Streptomyces sp. NPDC001719]